MTHASTAPILPRRHATRAVEIIEFVFIMPMVLILAMFIADMGRLGFVNGAINDAAYTAARTAAAVGSTGGTQTVACDDGGLHRVAVAYCEALAGIPGVPGPDQLFVLDVPRPSGSAGACRGSDGSLNRTVQVQVAASVTLMTPGLETLLALLAEDTDTGIPDTFTLASTAVVRCEVVIR